MFVWPIERHLSNMIFDFDRNSVTHSLLPQRRFNVGLQSTSALGLFGFVVCICLSFAITPASASEQPKPGVFEVVKSESEIRVLVYRGGLLGGFGHNHVISTSDIGGRIVISGDPTGSSVELTIPVESFEVDIEAYRVEEGDDFKSEVSDKAKLGTRNNMLGAELLKASDFPNIAIRSESWSGELAETIVNAEIIVRDESNFVSFPASVHSGDVQIAVTGSLTVTHEQLGLKPFAKFLGGLRVRDELEIKFRITASRLID
jgi:polyisoprenoid-binding protein YceI